MYKKEQIKVLTNPIPVIFNNIQMSKDATKGVGEWDSYKVSVLIGERTATSGNFLQSVSLTQGVSKGGRGSKSRELNEKTIVWHYRINTRHQVESGLERIRIQNKWKTSS